MAALEAMKVIEENSRGRPTLRAPTPHHTDVWASEQEVFLILTLNSLLASKPEFLLGDQEDFTATWL